MILKLSMKHQGEELYTFYINRDLGTTLTYLRQGQHRSPMHLYGEKLSKCHLMGKSLWKWANGLMFMILKKIGPQGQDCPHPGAIYMYITIIFKDLLL